MEEDFFEDPKSSPGKSKFSLDEFISKHRYSVVLGLLGAILMGLGAFLLKDGWFDHSRGVEVLDNTSKSSDTQGELVVDISGSVEKPGVYKMPDGSRIEDLLIVSGGLSNSADRVWVEKTVNRAAKLVDGQKLFIPSVDERSNDGSANIFGTSDVDIVDTSSPEQKTININSATQSELESLWGIGPVYALNIIEHRPYSSVEELLTKDVIKKNVYERNKSLLTVY